MERVLVTGGLGFIGSNFIRYLMDKTDAEIVNLDAMTYAGNPDNVHDIEDNNRYKFIKGDIRRKDDVEKAIIDCDVVFNFAAESHVDRSIQKADDFITTDIFGLFTLLESVRKHDIERFVQIGTDEVYGSIQEGSFKETDRLDPSSPYSASKAGADLLVNAYYKTYGMPVITTRSCNNFGPYQHTEKLIPLFITNAIQNKNLPLYGDGKNVRDWIYVLDNCSAIKLVSDKGKLGEIYNISTSNERTNIEITNIILKELKKPLSLIKNVDDRLGHDRRYSIDTTKLSEIGNFSNSNFEEAIKNTINWYVENKWWWNK